MKRIKSTPQDEITLRDKTANPADRASSASKLAFDGLREQVNPVLDNWLRDSDPLLRSESVWMLIARFGNQKYIDEAINMVHRDSDYVVRGTAVRALTLFAKEIIGGERHRDQIIKELFISLLNDKDELVQKDSYEGLYRLITKKELKDDKDYFDLNKDVDWDLLQPYLEKYNLQRSE